MSDVATINELAGRAPPGIGHNAPPLDEQLADEMVEAIARAEALIEAAKSSQIAGDDDAAKVATLVKMMRDHERDLKLAHDTRKQPFLDAGRTIDAAYNAHTGPLAAARAALGKMLDAWEDRRRREADAERARIEAEQRRQEEEAERAREAAEAAKANGKGSIAAELDAIRAQEDADRLARQAATMRPEPIRTLTGAVTTRREIAFEITDVRKALGWLVRNRGNEITQAARTIIGKHLQSVGVDAVERGISLPGIEARIEKRAQVR